MNPRLKAYLFGVGLLALAAVFGVRAAWKYQYRDSVVGATLGGIAAAGSLYGGLSYLLGRPDTPKPNDQTAEPPPGGSP